MANKRLEIMDLKQLLLLKITGKSNREISQILGRSRNTINDYVKLFKNRPETLVQLSLLDSKELLGLINAQKGDPNVLKSDRYSDLLKHQQVYLNHLKRPGATYQTIWADYRRNFPKGYGYTQFKKYLKTFTKQTDYSLPMSHKYGDKLFIDYTGKKLPVVNSQTGEVLQMQVFIGVLGGSSYTYVEACESQGMEDFFNCTVNCMEYFGGVPQALVPDNLKSAVIKASKYEATINRQYQALALHYNTVVYPTRAVKPKDKALVEGAVKLVYQRMFYHLSKQTFFSLSALNEQIWLLLKEYNNRPLYQQQISRTEQFETHEKSLLMALPPNRFEVKLVKKAKVQKNCHVWLEKHHYSVPHSYIGKQVQLHYNNRNVEVYYDLERIALHQRSFQPWTYTTIKEHMPSAHQFVMDWSAEKFIRWAKKIGTSVGQYVEKVLDTTNYPEQAYKSCMGILQLAKKYTPERLEKACSRGLQYEKYSYRTIDRILAKGLDQLEEQPEINPLLNDHHNVRGAAYYEQGGK